MEEIALNWYVQLVLTLLLWNENDSNLADNNPSSVITHPCFYFNIGLSTPPFKLAENGNTEKSK